MNEENGKDNKSFEYETNNLIRSSFNEKESKKDLENIGLSKEVEDQVELLINLACQAKLSGVIASAQDITLARKISKEIKIFCPGIRGDANTQDQKRTMSYKEFNSIADERCYAVIGRPIYEGNALENIKTIINSAK